MLATGSPKHYYEWRRYAELEPFGEPWKRESIMATRTINAILQAVPSDGKKQDFYDDDAFVPKYYPVGESPLEIEIASQCKAADELEGLGF